jgi:hypothetical protein
VAGRRPERRDPEQSPDIAAMLTRPGSGQVRRYAPGRRLGVARARAALRQYPEAIGVRRQLRRERPGWLPRQRRASDIPGMITRRRRTLAPGMRDLASSAAVSRDPLSRRIFIAHTFPMAAKCHTP